MKPGYKNFEARERTSFLTVPPAGAYVARIENVNVQEPTETNPRTVIELIVDITEGEYTHRYKDLFDDQKSRFGNANYRGTFRLTVPTDDDADEDNWIKRKFETSMWCIEQSNPNFEWDWDEKKLRKLSVGISVRNKKYDYNGKVKNTTEIGRLEVVQDVRDGKVRPMQDRDQTKKDNQTNDAANGFTAVNDEDVPWN